MTWFQRLGAEAAAGAIADMYGNHDALNIKLAYLGLISLLRKGGGQFFTRYYRGGAIVHKIRPVSREIRYETKNDD